MYLNAVPFLLYLVHAYILEENKKIRYSKYIKMKILLPIICLFLIYNSELLAQNFDDVKVTSEHVRNNIHVLFGAGGNIGVLEGEDGFVIVDNQFEPLAEKIKLALGEIGEGDVTYTINTHFHFDHADGNKAFGKAGATIVAHENARHRMMEDILIQVPGFDTLTQEAYPEEALPALTFQSELNLHLNDETIRLIHVPSAHTDTDALIHFVESNVIHAGDVFVRYGIPFIDGPNGGSVSGMIDGAELLIDLCDEETLIIPGHGQVSKQGDVISFRDMLVDIRQRVSSLMNEGKELGEILESKPARGYAGELHADYIVLMIYQELNGK